MVAGLVAGPDTGRFWYPGLVAGRFLTSQGVNDATGEADSDKRPDAQGPKGEGRAIYFDSAKASPPGFALRVTSSGGRSYAPKFYVKGSGARGGETLGNVDAINLDDARKKATAKWRLAQDGKDLRFLAATNKARTVEAVFKDYIEAVKARARRPSRDTSGSSCTSRAHRS